eukprot:Pgem_evm1s9659
MKNQKLGLHLLQTILLDIVLNTPDGSNSNFCLMCGYTLEVLQCNCCLFYFCSIDIKKHDCHSQMFCNEG